MLIPAGGTGSRFGGSVPKQFLPLRGRLVLEWSIASFLAESAVERIWVALSANIPVEAEEVLVRLAARHRGRLQYLDCAGATRAETVRNALELMAESLEPADPWVLVHDAARPGLTRDALQRLLAALPGAPDGAILALPVADTLKRAATASGPVAIAATVPREALWQAQTPQAFPLQLLRTALAQAGSAVSDEASAVEQLGRTPLLVEGDPQNLKLTRAGDAWLLDAVLAAREEQA